MNLPQLPAYFAALDKMAAKGGKIRLRKVKTENATCARCYFHVNGTKDTPYYCCNLRNLRIEGFTAADLFEVTGEDCQLTCAGIDKRGNIVDYRFTKTT